MIWENITDTQIVPALYCRESHIQSHCPKNDSFVYVLIRELNYYRNKLGINIQKVSHNERRKNEYNNYRKMKDTIIFQNQN